MIYKEKQHWPEDRRFNERIKGQANRGEMDKVSGQKANRELPATKIDPAQVLLYNNKPGIVEMPTFDGGGTEKELKLHENEAYEPGIGKYTLSYQELKRYGAEREEQYRNFNQQERRTNWSNYARPDYKPDNH